MAASVNRTGSKVTIQGGDQWKKALAPYVENEKAGLKVGVLEGATYPTGELVAPILAVHEFGGEIKKPERKQTMHFKQNKDGTVGNRFVKNDKSNFSQDATVAAHTITIPARAPLRSTLAKKEGEWLKTLIELLKANPGKVKNALNGLGMQMAKDIQQSFEDGLEPPLKASTIRQKEKEGYTAHASKPVMRTGVTQEAIEHEYVTDLGALS